MDHDARTGQESRQMFKSLKSSRFSPRFPSSSEQKWSEPVSGRPGVPRGPSYLSKPETEFENALIMALINTPKIVLPQEIYDEIAGVGDERVKFFLRTSLETAHFTAEHGYHRTPLYHAAREGLVATTEWLLGRTKVKKPPLSMLVLCGAIRGGNTAVVALLLEHQPHIPQHCGAYLVEMAAIVGREDTLQLLLEHRVDMNARERGQFTSTALHGIARAGHVGEVDLLLKFGADPSLKDQVGNTARDLANMYGYQAVGSRLLQAEAGGAKRGQAPDERAAVSSTDDIVSRAETSGQHTVLGRQGPSLDIKLATTATHSEKSAKVNELENESRKLFIPTSGQDTIDPLGSIQDDLVPDVKQFQKISPASQPITNPADLLEALSIHDAIEFQDELGRQSDTESIDTVSAIHHDSLLVKCIDGAEEERRGQCSEIEHDGMSECIESSDPPSTDATDSMEDEECDFVATIDLEMQHTLEVLMTEFYTFCASWGGKMQDGENDSIQPQQRRSSSGLDQRPSSSSYDHSSHNSNRRLGRGKRLALEQDSDEEDRDEDGKKRPKRNKGSKNGDCTPLLACPYYKRDPAAHCKIGSCTGPGFKSVSRVKEHLYRRHRSPPQCARCGETFNGQEDLDSHVRSDIQCERHEVVVIEGICPRKLKLLKCKKKNEDDPSEEGRWRDVFRILFPGAPVPSPYFEVPSQTVESQHLPTTEAPQVPQVESFEHFSNALLPGLVEARLFNAIRERYKQLMEEELKNSLPEIIKTSVSDLLQAWKKSNSSAPRKPGVAPSTTSLPPTNSTTKTIPGIEHYASFSCDVTFPTLTAPHSTTAFESRQTVLNLQEPSDSSYTNAQDYLYPTDTLFDTIPDFSNLPTMLSTLNGAPDFWPSLSDTSLPQNQTWGGYFDPPEPIGKGKGRAEHAVDTFSWDL